VVNGVVNGVVVCFELHCEEGRTRGVLCSSAGAKSVGEDQKIAGNFRRRSKPGDKKIAA
jgi:hypothetical protein